MLPSGPSIRTMPLPDPASCYFDLRLRFPSSGMVRLAYTYPSSPAAAGSTTPGAGSSTPGVPSPSTSAAGTTVYSRAVSVTLR